MTATLERIFQRADDKKKESTAALWREYRVLLRRVNDETITPTETHQLESVIGELGITPAMASSHAASLRRHATIEAKAARLPDLVAKLDELQRQLGDWAERRQQIVASIDAEGAPIVAAYSDAEREKSEAEMAGLSAGDEPKKYTELYGVEVEPPPASRELTPEQMTHAVMLAQLRDLFAAMRGQLERGLIHRKDLDPAMNFQIERMIQHGIIAPGAYGLGEHPQKSASAAIINRVRKNRVLYEDLMSPERELYDLGVGLGWDKKPDLDGAEKKAKAARQQAHDEFRARLAKGILSGELSPNALDDVPTEVE